MVDVGLPENTRLFVNQSLCSYYRVLWSKSKKILSMGKINNFHISNGTIKIKIQEGSTPLSVTHNVDFEKYTLACFDFMTLIYPENSHYNKLVFLPSALCKSS